MRSDGFIIVLALWFVILLNHSVYGQEKAEAILIQNVTVIDGTGSPPVAARDVIIRDGRIESVSPTQAQREFEGLTIEGAERFLIPGIIDAHVHISHLSRVDAEALLQWMLEGGVTTIRDMAGDARTLAGLQSSLLRNEISGPSLHYSVLMAGSAFMSDPRLQEATIGYESGASPYMVALDDTTDIADLMAQAMGTGATGIKLYADLDTDLVKKATQEAQRRGLKVWAHAAVFPATPLDLIESGVNGLSHALYFVWEGLAQTSDFTLRAKGDVASVAIDSPAMQQVIQAMVRHGTVIDPTLNVFENLRSEENGPQRLEWAAAFTQQAHNAGVIIAAGSDDQGQPLAGELPNVHDELERLVADAHLTSLQTLRAASSGGAQAIGIQDRVGVIQPGFDADLVLLGADPAVDIRNTRNIVSVIKGGDLVR